MNKILIVIFILLSMNLYTSNTVLAGDVLKNAEIFQGIVPQRRLNIPGIQRSYSWEFENRFYTTLIVIDQQWYNSIRNQLQKRRRDHRHFPPMVYKSVRSLEKLIIEFKRVIPRTWSEERRVNFVLKFVQAIPYRLDETTGYDEYYKYATETLAEGQGDCEDSSILFAAILSGLGFESALLDLPGHLAVGVKGDFNGFYYSYNNDKYFYCETATPSDRTNFKLGIIPKPYQTVSARILPITPNAVQPKLVIPRTVPPKPKLPPPPSLQKAFQNGINLYKDARYNEAIKFLQLALSGLSKSEQRAEVYIYLGAAELGFGKSIPEVKDRFQLALRQNPSQELPWPDHQKFKPLFDEVRKESIGELTVTTLLPQTEIWIDGNKISRKKLGTGISRINLKLYKGTYTVEGIYGDVSKEHMVEIVPSTHVELEIELPPIVKHTPVSKASIGEIIPISINLTSNKRPNQVNVYYRIYNKNNKELGRYIKKMLLSRRQPASSTWIFDVNLPIQRSTGMIKYHIVLEYEGSPLIRDPKNRFRYHQISVIDDTPPPINLPPRIVFINPIHSSEVNQRIPIKAKVTDDASVKSVYFFYGYSRSRYSVPLKYNRVILTDPDLDIYTGHISAQREAGYIWYYLAVTDSEENEVKTVKRILEIKLRHKHIPPSNLAPKIELVDPPIAATINEKTTIIAQVTDDKAVNSVYLFYGFSWSRTLEPSNYYMKILTDPVLDIYTGHISPQRHEGYVWYYLTAIDREGSQYKLKKKVIEIRSRPSKPKPREPDKPSITDVNEPIVNQEIWANYAWASNIFLGDTSVFDKIRSDVVSFAYLRESESYQSIGIQLDYSNQHPLNMCVSFQWGPDLGNNNISYTLLGGIARYSNSNESIYITPILGVGLNYYPMERFAVDIIGTLKLPSTFDTTYLYHYEIATRIHIVDSLKLKIGLGQWYLGSYNFTSMQIGLGITF